MAAKFGGFEIDVISQAVILCGGLGTRLGPLTHATPKPLLPINGRPFLECLIGEVVRQGFRDVVLLAGFCADQIINFVKTNEFVLGLKANIRVVAEPVPSGTGGALGHAKHLLAPHFLMMNGDSLFDIPLRKLALAFEQHPHLGGMIALREIQNPDRYGLVGLRNGMITEFSSPKLGVTTGLINGGVYVLDRECVLPHISGNCSLEADIFPLMLKSRGLGGSVWDGFFIDIGVHKAYSQAHSLIPEMLRRPAIFFDRDGVLNVDHGYVGSYDRFEWINGARETILAANDAGYLVFVVTNQAGVARGLYSEADIVELFVKVEHDLAKIGAHIDDYRYCPHHIEGVVNRYRKSCSWRKPNPGMILDLMKQWKVDAQKSFLVGDKQSDIGAACAAGIPGKTFSGGSLIETVSTYIDVNS
jgi:D-glycero-D-manno-heptose 1,7-bisphosphate phosphatase